MYNFTLDACCRACVVRVLDTLLMINLVLCSIDFEKGLAVLHTLRREAQAPKVVGYDKDIPYI